MNKFKKGDRVEVIYSEGSTDSVYREKMVGSYGEVRDNSDTPHVLLDDGHSTFFCEDELKIDTTYNSPLRKALE